MLDSRKGNMEIPVVKLKDAIYFFLVINCILCNLIFNECIHNFIQALSGQCGFMAANMYARSIFGEDALANLSIEKPFNKPDAPVTGHIRIRAKSQVRDVLHVLFLCASYAGGPGFESWHKELVFEYVTSPVKC
jgi:hypothetical protein